MTHGVVPSLFSRLHSIPIALPNWWKICTFRTKMQFSTVFRPFSLAKALCFWHNKHMLSY